LFLHGNSTFLSNGTVYRDVTGVYGEISSNVDVSCE